jgi:uncharacterized protein (TIGR00255 family)
MIYSMTGYANRTIQVDNTLLQIDVRSVNHRFFELSVKCPDELRSLEQLIREKINHKINRGKIDLRIFHNDTNNGTLKTQLNKNILEHYISISSQIQQYLPQAKLESICNILHLPGILQHDTLDIATVEKLLVSEIEKLADELVISQQSEGEKLQSILLDKLNQIESIVIQALALMPKIKEVYRDKLKVKLFEALGEAMNNEQRFSQEFAFFCQKIDVDEELTRLQAHIKQFRDLLKTGGLIGKKIDFVTQEMHREANTFGAKSAALETSNQAVELKVLVEQIREQIQNIA